MQSPEIKEAKINEFKSGVRPSGNLIGTYRSPEYKTQKITQNPGAGGNVDLILTGKFVKGLFVQNPKPSVFKFDSSDSKAQGLFEKYGDDLKGLNQGTFNEVFRLRLWSRYIADIKAISGFK